MSARAGSDSSSCFKDGRAADCKRRTDMYLSTLRSHIEAMGGQLEVVARLPDGAVKISNFADLDRATV